MEKNTTYKNKKERLRCTPVNTCAAPSYSFERHVNRMQCIRLVSLSNPYRNDKTFSELVYNPRYHSPATSGRVPSNVILQVTIAIPGRFNDYSQISQISDSLASIHRVASGIFVIGDAGFNAVIKSILHRIS
jgi:hypothetical protein